MKRINQAIALTLMLGLTVGNTVAEGSSSENTADIREGQALSIMEVIAPQQERLKELGYYPISKASRANDAQKKKSISVEQVAAFNLMAQQAGLPYTKGVETKQAQALLNSSNVQKTLFPTIVPVYYMNEDEPYTFKTVRADKKCFFYGEIKNIQKDGSKLLVDVKADGGFEITANYMVPSRSPDFLVGDRIVIFGICTKKTEESCLDMDADLIAFAL